MSQAERQEVRRRYVAGETAPALAAAKGCKLAHIKYVLRGTTITAAVREQQNAARTNAYTAAVRRRGDAGRLMALSDAQRACLLQERRQGASYADLGRKYGYDQSTIRSAVRVLDPQLAKETARR